MTKADIANFRRAVRLGLGTQIDFASRVRTNRTLLELRKWRGFRSSSFRRMLHYKGSDYEQGYDHEPQHYWLLSGGHLGHRGFRR